MYHCGMRQVGERHVPYQVDLMVWSNRLDLLALTNLKGLFKISYFLDMHINAQPNSKKYEIVEIGQKI